MHPENFSEFSFIVFNPKIVDIQQLEKYRKNYIRLLYNHTIFKKTSSSSGVIPGHGTSLSWMTFE